MSSSVSPSSPLRITFLHPDLGIGGAERLIVDAALGLQTLGHSVELFTSHHQSSCSFQETNDGTLTVRVFGDFLPTQIAGRFKLFFAMLRQLYLTLIILLFYPSPDIFIVDQLSLAVPLLRLFTSSRVLFYCHFPDLLLSPRHSLLKRIYRFPFDFIEQLTTNSAHKILVNSAFTKEVFFSTFSLIGSVFHQHRRENVDILYPSINFDNYEPKEEYLKDRTEIDRMNGIPSGRVVFTSINRFERKKNIKLAIEATALVKRENKDRKCAGVVLIVAGGYDPLNRENVEHYPELRQAALDAGLTVADYPDTSGEVIFLRSFTESQRYHLFQRSAAILYTPANEHFGIVPVEAMFNRRPVIAVNSGGPLESIEHGKTGFLVEGSKEQFAGAMRSVLSMSESDRVAMGSAGRARVINKFSFASFTGQLNTVIQQLVLQRERDQARFPTDALLLLLAGVTMIAATLGYAWI